MTDEGLRPRPLRVLLVEDDDGDALLVEELLADAPTAVTLRRARTLAQARADLDVECVLLDLNLPDAAGPESLDAVLSGPARPAVVVLTGLADADLGVQAVAAGAQDYLVKGEVDAELLGRAVRYAVERKRFEQQEALLFRSRIRAAENSRLERALLPVPLVSASALHVEVGYRAGRAGVLGGDFYDVVERPDGSVLAVVGDVAGHGPDEAALGATLRTAWRTVVLAGLPEPEILGVVERVLETERGGAEIFTTLTMVTVTPERDAVDLYLAGHPSPILVGGDVGVPGGPSRPLPCDARGRALGLPIPGGWEALRVPLAPPWRLLLYTDGVVEPTLAGSTDRLGEAGLLAVIDAELAAGPDGLVERVLNRVRHLHGGDLVDDTALVVLGWPAR